HAAREASGRGEVSARSRIEDPLGREDLDRIDGGIVARGRRRARCDPAAKRLVRGRFDLEAPPAFVRNEPERLREKEALIGKRTIDAATVLSTSDRDEVEVGLVSEERELETSTSVLGSVAGAAVASGARHAC